MLYGLKESIGMLKAEGMDNVVARHHRLAEGTRKAVEGWGLELLCAHPRSVSNSNGRLVLVAGCCVWAGGKGTRKEEEGWGLELLCLPKVAVSVNSSGYYC
jgi:serine protease inhibitor ecotin